jgi:hypothetical protein
MGDRAAFIITLDPLWNNKGLVADLLEKEAVECHWATPWVVVGLLKQSHTDFGETFREWDAAFCSGSSITIVNEEGSMCWSNCHSISHEGLGDDDEDTHQS